MKRKILSFNVAILIFAFLVISFSQIALAELDEIKLSFFQGEQTSMAMEDRPANLRVSEINFVSIKGNELLINVPTNQEPGSYYGKIIADGKEIPLIIDVNDKDSPLKPGLLLKDKIVFPGKNLNFNLDIKVIKPMPQSSIIINYEIRNPDKTSITKERREEVIDSSKVLVDSVYVPSSLKQGKYLLVAKTVYDGKTAVTSEFFEVGGLEIPEVSSKLLLPFLIAIITLIFVLLSILFYLNKRLPIIIRNQPVHTQKIYREFVTNKKERVAREKLKKQAELIKRAYYLGVINKKTYYKVKKEVEKTTQKIRSKFSRPTKLKKKRKGPKNKK